METSNHRYSFYPQDSSKMDDATICSVSLGHEDLRSLERAVTSFPGATAHLAHLAYFRLGARVADATPAAMADELRAIRAERRQRAWERRQHRLAAKAKGGNHAR